MFGARARRLRSGCIPLLHRTWHGVPLPDGDDVVKHHPTMVTTRKYAVHVSRPQTGNMLKLFLDFQIHAQAKLSVLSIPACEKIALFGENERVIPASCDLGDWLGDQVGHQFWDWVVLVRSVAKLAVLPVTKSVEPT